MYVAGFCETLFTYAWLCVSILEFVLIHRFNLYATRMYYFLTEYICLSYTMQIVFLSKNYLRMLYNYNIFSNVHLNYIYIQLIKIYIHY